VGLSWTIFFWGSRWRSWLQSLRWRLITPRPRSPQQQSLSTGAASILESRAVESPENPTRSTALPPKIYRQALGGGQAGVTIGWNSHLFLDSGFSGIVWGIEGDLSWVDSRGSALAASPPGDRIGTVEQWSGSLRPRLGYSFAAGNDRYVLAYATGGLAVTGAAATIVDASGTLNDTHARWGWTVGGGLEFNVVPFSDRWTAKVEYRWAEYAAQPYFPQNPRSNFDLRSIVPLEDNRFLLGLNRKSSSMLFF
jgi:opacity protein-like surface antigen